MSDEANYECAVEIREAMKQVDISLLQLAEHITDDVVIEERLLDVVASQIYVQWCEKHARYTGQDGIDVQVASASAQAAYELAELLVQARKARQDRAVKETQE